MRVIERLLRAIFPHRDIEHAGDLYLRRFYLTPQIFGWRLMLHRIARPDRDRALHCHPFDFATFCLRGGYVEVVRDPGGAHGEILVAGQIRLRAAEHTHRIVRILGPNAWTLILHGPRRRRWGFWEYRGGVGDTFTVAEDYFKPGYDKAEPAKRRWAR